MKASLRKVVWCNRFFFPVYYGFCPSAHAWDREMRRLDVKTSSSYPVADGKCSTFSNKEGTSLFLVTIADALDAKDDPVAIVGLLVHEAVHVWQGLCRVIGEDEPSSEFEAYVIQHVTSELIEAYAKTRKPRFRV
jgi:hypothetical protein